jgi:hypothetical protein
MRMKCTAGGDRASAPDLDLSRVLSLFRARLRLAATRSTRASGLGSGCLVRARLSRARRTIAQRPHPVRPRSYVHTETRRPCSGRSASPLLPSLLHRHPKRRQDRPTISALRIRVRGERFPFLQKLHGFARKRDCQLHLIRTANTHPLERGHIDSEFLQNDLLRLACRLTLDASEDLELALRFDTPRSHLPRVRLQIRELRNRQPSRCDF